MVAAIVFLFGPVSWRDDVARLFGQGTVVRSDGLEAHAPQAGERFAGRVTRSGPHELFIENDGHAIAFLNLRSSNGAIWLVRTYVRVEVTPASLIVTSGDETPSAVYRLP